MLTLSRLSAKGQITLPKEIRTKLGLEPKDLVAYEIHEDGVLLKRVEPFDESFHRALAGTLDEWDSPEDDEAFRDL
jgi:antitoxin PrlF